MKTVRIALASLLVAFVLVGCPGPAVYGGKLALCSETSKTWEEYVPCCVDVAHHQNRDPSFCYPEPTMPAMPDAGGDR